MEFTLQCPSKYPPVFRFQGVHGVVIHGIEFMLPNPVEDVDGQQLEQDVDEACAVFHVHWNAIIRNLTDDPSTTTSAHIHLPGNKYVKKQPLKPPRDEAFRKTALAKKEPALQLCCLLQRYPLQSCQCRWPPPSSRTCLQVPYSPNCAGIFLQRFQFLQHRISTHHVSVCLNVTILR